MKLFRILAVWCFILFATAGIQQAQAQTADTPVAATQEIEMADTLRQDGKIYVVVIVLLTVLGGMIAYLVTLDRKVTRLEKQIRD